MLGFRLSGEKEFCKGLSLYICAKRTAIGASWTLLLLLINSVCDPYLKNGRLVELFPEIEKQKWQLYLYRPYQTIVAERVMWVYDRLKEILFVKIVQA